VLIIRPAGKAPSRRPRLTSNVMHTATAFLATIFESFRLYKGIEYDAPLSHDRGL